MAVQINIEKIRRKTGKAILVAVEVEFTGRRTPRDVWFPRSQVRIENDTLHCPDWLAQAKLDEILGGNSAGAWFN